MPNGTSHLEAEYTRGPILGRGASGVAFIVRPKRDPQRQLVAKEMCIVRTDEKRRREALAESQLLQELSHPNIIICYDVIQDVDMLYIVMEYADGGDLSHWIQLRRDENRRLTERTIMLSFVQICAALHYIHSKKILHRDLKPANIFIVGEAQDLSECTIKLGDFGIAKMIDGTMGQANSTVGTPSYLSPEICKNNPYGMKADIWSLGVVLYELTCLKVPFHAGNLPAMALMICTSEQKAVPEEYSTGLAELVKCLLYKDPTKRPVVSALLALPYVQGFISDSQRAVFGDITASSSSAIASASAGASGSAAAAAASAGNGGAGTSAGSSSGAGAGVGAASDGSNRGAVSAGGQAQAMPDVQPGRHSRGASLPTRQSRATKDDADGGRLPSCGPTAGRLRSEKFPPVEDSSSPGVGPWFLQRAGETSERRPNDKGRAGPTPRTVGSMMHVPRADCRDAVVAAQQHWVQQQQDRSDRGGRFSDRGERPERLDRLEQRGDNLGDVADRNGTEGDWHERQEPRADRAERTDREQRSKRSERGERVLRQDPSQRRLELPDRLDPAERRPDRERPERVDRATAGGGGAGRGGGRSGRSGVASEDTPVRGAPLPLASTAPTAGDGDSEQGDFWADMDNRGEAASYDTFNTPRKGGSWNSAVDMHLESALPTPEHNVFARTDEDLAGALGHHSTSCSAAAFLAEAAMAVVAAAAGPPPPETCQEPAPPFADPPPSSVVSGLMASTIDIQARVRHRNKRRAVGGRPPLLMGPEAADGQDPHSPIRMVMPQRGGSSSSSSVVGQEPSLHSTAPLPSSCSAAARAFAAERSLSPIRSGVSGVGGNGGGGASGSSSLAGALEMLIPATLRSSGSAPSLPPLPKILHRPAQRSRSVVGFGDCRELGKMPDSRDYYTGYNTAELQPNQRPAAHLFRTAPLPSTMSAEASNAGPGPLPLAAPSPQPLPAGGSRSTAAAPREGPSAGTRSTGAGQGPLPAQTGNSGRLGPRDLLRGGCSDDARLAPKLPTALTIQGDTRHWRESSSAAAVREGWSDARGDGDGRLPLAARSGDSEARMPTARLSVV